MKTTITLTQDDIAAQVLVGLRAAGFRVPPDATVRWSVTQRYDRFDHPIGHHVGLSVDVEMPVATPPTEDTP